MGKIKRNTWCLVCVIGMLVCMFGLSVDAIAGQKVKEEQLFYDSEDNIDVWLEYSGEIKEENKKPVIFNLPISDNKTKFGKVKVFEQSKYQYQKPNHAYYWTHSYNYMLVGYEYDENGKKVLDANGKPKLVELSGWRDAGSSVRNREVDAMRQIISDRGWSINDRYVVSHTLDRDLFS
jgi:hypothetical protein